MFREHLRMLYGCCEHSGPAYRQYVSSTFVVIGLSSALGWSIVLTILSNVLSGGCL